MLGDGMQVEYDLDTNNDHSNVSALGVWDGPYSPATRHLSFDGSWSQPPNSFLEGVTQWHAGATLLFRSWLGLAMAPVTGGREVVQHHQGKAYTMDSILWTNNVTKYKAQIDHSKKSSAHVVDWQF